jgi:GNAT superfamily N-acetyltransferase
MLQKQEIINKIANYSTDRKVFNELGEALFYDEGDVWIFLDNSFGCLNGSKLKYLYTESEYRSQGKGSEVLNQIDQYCKSNGVKEIKTVAPISRQSFYEKRGWKVTKTYSKWIKINKTII